MRLLILLLLSFFAFMSSAQESSSEPNKNLSTNKRYIFNNDGTVTDKKTDLMWLQCSMGQVVTNVSCVGDAESLNWQDAVAQSLASNNAGYSDWRLPNIKELSSIVDWDSHTPAIDQKVFPNTSAGNYWSSSPSSYNGNRSWGVEFDYGYSHEDLRRWADYSHVRLVRDY